MTEPCDVDNVHVYLSNLYWCSCLVMHDCASLISCWTQIGLSVYLTVIALFDFAWGTWVSPIYWICLHVNNDILNYSVSVKDWNLHELPNNWMFHKSVSDVKFFCHPNINLGKKKRCLKSNFQWFAVLLLFFFFFLHEAPSLLNIKLGAFMVVNAVL